MSQENVELFYRANDAFNRRDLDAFLALADPDVEMTPLILGVEGGGPLHGHDGVRSWWEKLHGAFPDFSAEIEEVRDLGDVTVTRVRQRGQGMESDAPTDQTAWLVTEWRHKKAIWWGTFRSEAKALEAAGLRESAMSQENIEVVKRVAEAWNRDDLDAFIDLLDPDIEWYPAIERSFEGRESAFSRMVALWIGGAEVRRGHAGVRKGWESYRGEGVESLEVRLDEIRDLGESVLALGEMKITGRTSQLELTSEVALLSTFRGDKIVSAHDFMSHAEGLEAAGLSE